MKFVELPTFQRHQYQAIPEDIEGDATLPITSETNKDIAVQQKRRWLMLAALVCSFLAACLLVSFHSDLPADAVNVLEDLLEVPSPPVNTVSSTLSKSTPYHSVSHPDPPTSLWGNVAKPYPTGAFWTNFVVKEGITAVGLYPYGIKTLEEGVQVSYGAFRRRVSDTKITDSFDVDLQLSSQEDYLSRRVDAYDNVSVTMSYQTTNNGQFKAHLVKSSPFVTVVYNGATPVIRSPVIHIVAAERRQAAGNTTVKGAVYLLTMGHYQRWLLYCSDANALTWDSAKQAFVGSGPFRGVVRVAVLPVESYEASLQALLPYVSRYPTGGAVTFSYPSPASAVMNLQYQTEGDGPLLMFALPHQLPLLPPNFVDNDDTKVFDEVFATILCMKGRLKAVVGDNWKLSYALPALGWSYGLMDRLSTAQLDEIALNLITEVRQVLPLAVDPYMFGKEMGRMARLALIADNLGISDARQEAIYTLETSIIPWLQGMNHDILLYDQTYGGLVTTYGIADSANDFGQGWYSDHHFHFGYFANVVAVLAKLDLPFYEANKAALDTFLRDICNPDSNDPDYPFARHKDLFDGHSWASGLFQQGNGKGQESSSESVNAYYGCALYGLAIGNLEFQKFAQLMLAMELQATQYYWHMKSDDIYDSVFAANRMVGNVGALDVTATTWFGDAIEYVHGINMMPLSPVTSLLFDVNYVKMQYPVVASTLKHTTTGPISSQCMENGACRALELIGLCCPTREGIMLGCCRANMTQEMGNEWKAYILADLAVVDKDAAWSQLMRMEDFGVGNSRANSLYWAASRPPPVVGYNSSQKAPEVVVKAACSANSACVATGVQGQCCPTDTGLFLGCCPFKEKEKEKK